MNIQTQLSEREFEVFLTDEVVRQFQIIQGALMAGATMFLLVIGLLYGESPVDISDAEIVYILSIMNVFFFFAAALNAYSLLPRRMFADENIERTLTDVKTAYEQSLALIRSAMIVRLAVLEGSVIFSFAILIIAVTGGILQTEPIYFLNGIPFFIFLAAGALTFPTKERLVETFKREILKRT